MTRKKQVRTVIFDTVKKQKGLSLGIVSAVIGAVVFALIPPLILADIVDSITAGTDAAFARILLYFAMLALTGFTESARESLLRCVQNHQYSGRYLVPKPRSGNRIARFAAVPVLLHAPRAEKYAGSAD